MGAHCVSVKLLSQEHEATWIDWRACETGMIGIKQIELPDKIFNQYRAHMASLGIVFGCYDFIVDKNGNYIFLEVNEMGQFL